MTHPRPTKFARLGVAPGLLLERAKDMVLLPELSLPKPVVLVVDDEPFILTAVARVLKQRFEVVTALGPQQARAAAQGRDVKVLLTDYMMPLESGISLARSLRARNPTLQTVVVTALPDSEEIRLAVRAGEIQRVVPKPWSPLVLLREALELSHRAA
jgi:two-component system response regulator HupR/HoxA